MNNWKNYRIADICNKILSGGTPNSRESSYYNGSIPWLNTKEVDFCRIYFTEKTITEAGLANSSAKWVPKHSVIVAMYGATAAKVAYSEIDLTTNQACCNLVINPLKADSLYVYYYLSNVYSELHNLAIGVAQQNLSVRVISDFPIILPSLDEQKRIAGILSALDDKIELNRRINENLEQQAQALFKHWFVENPKTSEWEQGNLNDVISIYNYMRKPLSGQERERMDKIYPYYGAASLMDYVDNYIFNGVYLLLGEDGTVIDEQGYPILQYVYGKFWVNNHAHILKGINGFTTESLYILLKQTNIRSIVTGAVQPKISQANLKSVKITIPPQDMLLRYNEIISPMFGQIRKNNDEIIKLSQLRDTILPKLMNGEITINS